MQGRDCVEEGKSRDEEGLEDFGKGDVGHLYEPGRAQRDEDHADDAENEDDGRSMSCELRHAGPARVPFPREILI